MALLYTVVSRRNPIKPDEQPKFFLQSKIRGHKSHKEILAAAAKSTTLSPKEVDAAVSEWKDALFTALSEGFSVEVEGLGTFSTSIRSTGVETEAAAAPAKVTDIALAFRAKPEVYALVNSFKLEKFSADGTL
jgi:predicted histone-like DNA-binding protein